jgi:hypothetical protein
MTVSDDTIVNALAAKENPNPKPGIMHDFSCTHDPCRCLPIDEKEQAAREAPFKPQPLRDKLIWVGVDLDGTLAYPKWTPDNPTSEIGDPIPESIEKVHELWRAGYKVIVHTSRPWTDYQVIEQWLQHYNVPFKEIQCGKPLYAAYVDDRAIHASEESWLPE